MIENNNNYPDSWHNYTLLFVTVVYNCGGALFVTMVINYFHGDFYCGDCYRGNCFQGDPDLRCWSLCVLLPGLQL